MLAVTLDLLFIFALTTPLVGWAASKLGRSLSGVYAALGLAVSGATLYDLSLRASTHMVTFPSQGRFFLSYLRIDMLSVFMATVYITLGFFVAVYSIRYMQRDTGVSLYYALLLTMIGGMTGVVFAGDFFTLFVFWELMCIPSYVLVAFRKEDWEPVEAGLKYVIMSSTGSATVLFGISLIYGMTGTLNFEVIASALGGTEANSWLYMAFLLVLIGFGVKAAIVPLHTWLPDAHSAAPSPISAMLSGVVIETGVYALCRTLFVCFGLLQVQWSTVLAVLSVITMTLGNVTALLQRDLKRLLAYSSIGHVGYMLVGLSAGTRLGLTGTTLHIFNHALMKGAAFLCAGAIIYKLGTRRLDDIAGVGRRMPVTATAFGISLLALTGMPPLNGFVSELTLFTSAVQVDKAWLGIAIVLNSALSAGYYLRVLRSLIQSARSEKLEKVKEAPITMLLPICIMAALIILFGIWPDLVLGLARKAAVDLLSMSGR